MWVNNIFSRIWLFFDHLQHLGLCFLIHNFLWVLEIRDMVLALRFFWCFQVCIRWVNTYTFKTSFCFESVCSTPNSSQSLLSIQLQTLYLQAFVINAFFQIPWQHSSALSKFCNFTSFIRRLSSPHNFNVKTVHIFFFYSAFIGKQVDSSMLPAIN